MGILSWILLGLIVGALAKAIHPVPVNASWIISIIVGIIGAIIGGWIGTLFGFGSVVEFNIKTLLLAIGGSVLILWLYSVLKNR
ncbi:MAG: yeaQ [Bacteroidetes bacterium]|nr:yeaQ [Bacteroidota bacterium]